MCCQALRWTLACSVVLALLLVGESHAHTNDYVSTWQCTPLQTQTRANGAVLFSQVNCTGSGLAESWIPFEPPQKWTQGPMVFNIVTVDLSVPGIRLLAHTANRSGAGADAGLQNLAYLVDDLGNYSGLSVVVGQNGGYFWRADTSFFIDNICWGKTRFDAQQNLSSTNANYGLGDTAIVIDGVVHSHSCSDPGDHLPTGAVLDAPYGISIMSHGAAFPAGVANGLANGPNLVSWDASTGSAYWDVPWDTSVDEFAHEAGSAMGFSYENSTSTELRYAHLVTADGHDGCASSDPTCGIEAPQMAFFFRDYVGASQAMSLDGGGSTTMWVQDVGIVSSSGGGLRNLFSGLFVTYDP